MKRDLAGAIRVPALERQRDARVQLPLAVARNRFDQHVGDLVVREHEAALRPLVCRAEQTGGDRLGDRESHRGFAPRARADEQADVELVSDDRRRTQHRLRARREAPSRCAISVAPARRQPKLRHRTPFPPRSIVPDRALFDQRAEQLRDEQRIAFRVAIEKGEKLAADLLPMERRLEPLLHVVARQSRERDLARDLVTAEHLLDAATSRSVESGRCARQMSRRSVSSCESRCSSASHDVLSANCISSSTMTSGRSAATRANVFA